MANKSDEETNNLKSIKNNYANASSCSSSSDGDNNADDDESKEKRPVTHSNTPSSSSSNYKILTPFVPYKNPFVVDEDDLDDHEVDTTIRDEFLVESNSKRQKSEFNSSSKLSGHCGSSSSSSTSSSSSSSTSSGTTKVYRTKISPSLNKSNDSSDSDDSDVDISSITINPKLLKSEEEKKNNVIGTSSTSKRKRQDSQSVAHLNEENSNTSTSTSDDVLLDTSVSMDSDNEPLSLQRKSSNVVTKKLASIEENSELLAEATAATTEGTSLDTKSTKYWHMARTSSNSFSLNDIVNREFGYSSRPGHGTQSTINLFNSNLSEKTSRRLLYDNQLQTPRHFIRKAMSGLNYVRKMKLTQSLSFHEGCVNALNFNRVGTMLASGSDDYQVCLWDWAKNCLVLNFDSGHKSNVFQVDYLILIKKGIFFTSFHYVLIKKKFKTKFIPFTGDSQIATCARDGQVRLALISSSGAHIGTKKLAKHSDSCHKVKNLNFTY